MLGLNSLTRLENAATPEKVLKYMATSLLYVHFHMEAPLMVEDGVLTYCHPHIQYCICNLVITCLSYT